MLARAAKRALLRPGAARLLVKDLVGLPDRLFDEARLARALSSGLGDHSVGATWVRHTFAPSGLSLVGFGPYCRVALHTWPERGALSLDLYGTDADLEGLFGRCLDALLE